MTVTYQDRLAKASDFLKNKIKSPVDIFIVAGSGFRDALPELSDPLTLAMKDIPGCPIPKVDGHGAEFRFGTFKGKRVLVATGRIHYYEGHPLEDVVFAVRMVHRLGCKSLLLTNATGSVDLTYQPGSIVLIRDQINLTGANCEMNQPHGKTIFIDMTSCYEPTWRERVQKKHSLKEGVYVGLTGPTYETLAEAKMLALLGGHVVGMSTVQECIAARALDMKVLGVSLVTNLAGGLGGPVKHADVLAMARSQSELMTSVIATAMEIE